MYVKQYSRDGTLDHSGATVSVFLSDGAENTCAAARTPHAARRGELGPPPLQRAWLRAALVVVRSPFHCVGAHGESLRGRAPLLQRGRWMRCRFRVNRNGVLSANVGRGQVWAVAEIDAEKQTAVAATRAVLRRVKTARPTGSSDGSAGSDDDS